VKQKSQVVEPSYGGLSLESKEFTAENPEKPPEKKKAKKVRSNKNKKKK
jgi:hypothetical protein